MQNIQSIALLTDLYELTMAQGYLHNRMNQRVVFDMFFRRQPFQGGFSIFAGLKTLLDNLEMLHFDEQDLAYLQSLGLFRGDFLDFLRNFRFQGDVYALNEGTPIFPHEPIMRVHASLIEAQLIESLVLNVLNFQSLIATKAARLYLAANGGTILEFGLRRAQGADGALSASRAAYIGGAGATSNTMAGQQLGIPVSGTMAHSWVMAFDSELHAFERFVELYPNDPILLIDTYNTLESGIMNAIRIGRTLAAQGRTFGVRLDSGDIQYLSLRVRALLDHAGLHNAKIAVSNELNEDIIHQLVTDGAPVDSWGVGSNLVTGAADASFSGVYKLAAMERNGRFEPTMKITDVPEKSTNPGIKQLYRFYDEQGSPLADLISFEDEAIQPDQVHTFYDPFSDWRQFRLHTSGAVTPLLNLVMHNGTRTTPPRTLETIRSACLRNLDALDTTYKRIINPHIYRVSISERLKSEKDRMMKRYLRR